MTHVGPVSASVSEWIRSTAVSDLDSEFGESVAVASEYGGFDDARYVVDESELVIEERGGVERAKLVEAALGSVARATQRLHACSLHRLYAKGRMHNHPDFSVRAEVNQKFFRVEKYSTLTSLDDPGFFSEVSKGGMVTRLAAATGLGKTRKLPGMTASKSGVRVLQLELDNNVAADAMAFQAAEYNVTASARSWRRQKGAFLTTMSYHDFRGVVLSAGRDRLFEDFDVFYFDEAHVPLAVVWAAKQYFAAFSKPHNSLLVVSATVSTEAGNNVAAHAVGKFEHSTVPLDIEAAMATGDLVGKHLRDRTIVLVPSDEMVALVRSYYEQEGITVCVLDSGSMRGDVAESFAVLSAGSAAVPRVLVALEWYGTSYNLPLSYVITSATVRVYELAPDNTVLEKVVPVMERVVVQHKGRTGRGLAVGSGGWVLSPERRPDSEFMPSEALESYLSLVAAGIVARPGLFDSVTRVLPKGVNRQVARLLLRSTLPAAAAVRYLGSDGLVARRFLKGFSVFCQQGETLLPSKDEYPLGYESWLSEKVGGYYVGDDSAVDVEVRVPFPSVPGLRIVLHALSAVEQGLLEIPAWNVAVNEDSSDDEFTGVRKVVKRSGLRAKPRQVVDKPLPAVPTESTEAGVWAYDADPEKAKVRRKRNAMSWEADGEGKGAAMVLLRAVRDGSLGVSVAGVQLDVPEYGGKAAYSLPLGAQAEVAVDSPGGGRVLLVARSVHDKWMRGEVLRPAEFLSVVTDLRELRAVKRFAMSTAFDNWSSTWLSWFACYAEVDCMQAVKSAGFSKVALEVLSYLYDRFRAEVKTVVSSSALYADSLRGWFSKSPSITKFVKAYRKGRVPIAQSDKFVERLLAIKDGHDVAVKAIEDVGLFAPGMVTAAQQRLPLRDGRRRLSVIDERVVPQPSARREVEEKVTQYGS